MDSPATPSAATRLPWWMLPWRAYDAWILGQDKSTARVAFSWPVVLLFLLVSEATLWACARAPGLGHLVELDLDRALLTQVPWIGWYLLMVVTRPLDRMKPRAAYAFVLVGNMLVEFWLASLMSMASPWGTLLFAAFFLNGAAAHGWLFRSSLREPVGVLATLGAAAGASMLAQTPLQLSVIGVAALSGVATSLFVGTAARQQARARAQNQELTAALHAQMLSERAIRTSELQDVLEAQLGINHDVKNQLAAVNANLEYLRDGLRGGTLDDVKDFQAAVQDMLAATSEAKKLLDTTRRAGQAHLASVATTVAVGPVVERVVAAQRWSFPSVSIHAVMPPAVVQATVSGGEDNLHRVLTNLVANACQGDGNQHARNVTVMVSIQGPSNDVSVVVEDDGPGFPSELLLGPVEGFKTTKRGGTGLGLYTCERLLWSGGGRLNRANTKGGGARVEVTLSPPRLA